jgi:hypothetical protein
MEGKVFPMLNEAPHYDIWGNGITASGIYKRNAYDYAVCYYKIINPRMPIGVPYLHITF